ncbi:MAG: response regulator [Pseudolabrys sp.]|jgi:two-component system chemotaxis response regulator CheY
MDLDVSKSVLVVDDSSTMIRLVCGMLQQIGFQDIETAQGGNTALAKLKTHHRDLMISDLHMEPMSGLDLLLALRGDSTHLDMPFIMMTTTSWTKKVVEARIAGANNYILKPFDVLALKNKIMAVFAENAGLASAQA